MEKGERILLHPANVIDRGGRLLENRLFWNYVSAAWRRRPLISNQCEMRSICTAITRASRREGAP